MSFEAIRERIHRPSPAPLEVNRIDLVIVALAVERGLIGPESAQAALARERPAAHLVESELVGAAGYVQLLREARSRLRRCPGCAKDFLAEAPADPCPVCGGALAAGAGETVASDAPSGPAACSGGLGRFEIIEAVGRGGMAAVYKARDTELGRIVALKVLRTLSPQATRRFLNEARHAARLSHPNIVPVFEADEDAGVRYLVMPFIEGRTFEEALRDPGDPRGRVALLETVARAVQHAHDRGIVHRDLKPSNILLGLDGGVFVADLGLSKDLAADTLTREGALLGTPAYMAPEQARGAAAVDARADVYALGMILYRILAGRPAFEEESLTRVLSRIDREGPPPLPAGAPRDLAAVCLRAIERDPARRTPTAAAFADDLRRHLAGEPVRARAPSRFRPRAALFTAALAVAVAGALALLATRGEDRAGAERRVHAAAEIARRLEYESPARPDEVAREAAALLDEALRLAPSLAAAWQERGRLHLLVGEEDGAARCLDRAVELDPESAAARFLRAQAGLAALQRRRGMPKLVPTAGGYLVEPAAPETEEDRALKSGMLGDFHDALRLYHGQHIRWEQQFAFGIVALIETRFDEAASHLAAALELAGPSHRVLFHLGLAELHRGRPGEAAARFDAALQARSDSGAARAHRGLARLLDWHRTRDEEAMRAAVEDLRAGGDSPESLAFVAVAHIAHANHIRWDPRTFEWRAETRDRSLGLYREALRLLDEALRRNPGFGIAHLHAGHACSEFARLAEDPVRFERAVLHFEEALRIGPATAYWHILHGNAWADFADRTPARETRIERYERSVQAYSRAIDPDPNHEYARIGRGRVRVDLARLDQDPDRNFEGGLADLSWAIALRGRHHAWARSVRADAALWRAARQGDSEARRGWIRAAVEDLQGVVAVDPGYRSAYRRLGFAHRELGEVDAMRAAFERAIEVDPSLEAELRPLMEP